MKIFLADLAHTKSVEPQSLTVPLNIGYIKSFADQAFGDQVQIELFKDPELLLLAASKTRPDVIGFSNYGWNSNLNKAIGKVLRQQLPDVLFVMGGPNLDPENDPQKAFLSLHNYIDFVIDGSGEEPFAELIAWRQIRPNTNESLPQNLIYLDENGDLKNTGHRTVTKNIEAIPSPYMSGSLDAFLQQGMVPLMETNRGCPFRCTFCAWGMAAQNLVRRFDKDNALQEIEYISERSTARAWIICDANFGILKRDVEIAQGIRAAKDKSGFPEFCQIWLAKNVTERNLEIGKILGDMVVPVMAVQSLTSEVLKAIKRDNISSETYISYQQQFHAIGSTTYSDLIVPLPMETLKSHLESLELLFKYGVDIIQNHNMRLLAGAETNLPETREQFGFKTKYRLIHGDAGEYNTPSGDIIRIFEYEESLRETNTMSEADLFYLRKFHFLVDFCWNTGVYKFLLKLLLEYGVNPVRVFEKLLEHYSEDNEAATVSPKLELFWRDFDAASNSEWFDSEDDIIKNFETPVQWQNLVGNEFEKLNIYFGIEALRKYKKDFDDSILEIVSQFKKIPPGAMEFATNVTVAEFSSLLEEVDEVMVESPEDLAALFKIQHDENELCDQNHIRLIATDKRKELQKLLTDSHGLTVSKIFNTQGYSLKDMRMIVANGRWPDAAQIRQII